MRVFAYIGVASRCLAVKVREAVSDRPSFMELGTLELTIALNHRNYARDLQKVRREANKVGQQIEQELGKKLGGDLGRSLAKGISTSISSANLGKVLTNSLTKTDYAQVGKEVGTSFGKGLASTLKSQNIGATVKSNILKTNFSGVGQQAGTSVGQGVAQGVKSQSGNVQAVMTGLVSGLTSALATAGIGIATSVISAGLGAIQKGFSSIIGLARTSVMEFTKFDDAAKGFEARVSGAFSNLAEKETAFRTFREEAQRLGAATSKTAADVAGAGTQLVTMGFSADGATQALEGVVKLSESTNASMENAGTTIGTAIAAFKELNQTQEDSVQVADLLSYAANNTATDFAKLQYGLQNVGPVANAVNQDIETTIAALSTLGTLSGEVGATGLKNMMNSLAAPSTKAAKALHGLAEANDGVLLAIRNSQGEVRNFLDIMQDFGQQINAVPVAEQQRLLIDIFGREALTAATITIDKISEAQQTLTALRESAKGTADQVSEELLSGIGGAFEKLNSAINGLALKFGDALAPAVEASAVFANKLITGLSETVDIFEPLKSQAKIFQTLLQDNPQYAEKLGKLLQELVKRSVEAVAGVAKKLLDYLVENPKAIDDAIEATKGFLKQVHEVLKAFAAIAKTVAGLTNGIINAWNATKDWFSWASKPSNSPFANLEGVLNPFHENFMGKGGKTGGGSIQSGSQVTTGRVTENYLTGLIPGQEYGASRSGGRRKHAGQDFDISGQQEAQSFIGGEVTRVGYDKSGYLQYVDIYNKSLDVVERIAEVAKITVKLGDKVKPGQAIGEGETKTGVFHYEIREDVNAQKQGGLGFEGTKDPVKFYESLGLVKRQGNKIVVTGGIGAGREMNLRGGHDENDGHDHTHEEFNKNQTITGSDRDTNIQKIVNEALKQGVTDKNQVAYMVATALHETGQFKFTREQISPGRAARDYTRPDLGNRTGSEAYKFRGRGYVQLTGRTNYQKYSKLVGQDLVSNPELAENPDVAAKVLVHGMKTGGFTGRGIDSYIGGGKKDISNARRTVNGYVQSQVDKVNAEFNKISPQIDKYISRAMTGGGSAQAVKSAAQTTRAIAPPVVAPPVIAARAKTTVEPTETLPETQPWAVEILKKEEEKRQKEREKLLDQLGKETASFSASVGRSGTGLEGSLEGLDHMASRLGGSTPYEEQKKAIAEINKTYEEFISNAEKQRGSIKAGMEDAQAMLSNEALSGAMREDVNANIVKGSKQILAYDKAIADAKKNQASALQLQETMFSKEEESRRSAANLTLRQLEIDQDRSKLASLNAAGKEKEATILANNIDLRQKEINTERQIEGIQSQVDQGTLMKVEGDAQINALQETLRINRENLKVSEQKKLAEIELAEQVRAKGVGFQQQELEIETQRLQISELTLNGAKGEAIALRAQVEASSQKLAFEKEVANIRSQERSGNLKAPEAEKMIAALQSNLELNLQNLEAEKNRELAAHAIAKAYEELEETKLSSQATDTLLDQQRRLTQLGKGNFNDLEITAVKQAQAAEMALKQQILYLRQLQSEGKITQERFEELSNSYRQVYDMTVQANQAENQKAAQERVFSINQQMGQSDISVLQSQSSYLQGQGQSFAANDLAKEAAIAQQGLDYESAKQNLESFILAQNVSAEAAQRMRANLEQVNQVKLDTLAAQFDPLMEMTNAFQSGLQNIFTDLLTEGELDFNSFLDSIWKSAAGLLAQFASQQFMGGIQSLFGGGGGGILGGKTGGSSAGGGGGLLGGIGSLLGGIFSFSTGRPTYNRNLSQAVSRERGAGNTPTIAVVGKEEAVLPRQEAIAYRSLLSGGVPSMAKGFMAKGSMPKGATGNRNSKIDIKLSHQYKAEAIEGRSEKYITEAEFRRGMQETAERTAKEVSSRMRNSYSYRQSVGMP